MALAIRNVDTGLFYAEGEWTSEPQLAEQFPNRELAEQVAEGQKLPNLEIVFLGGDPLRVIGGSPITPSN